MAELKKIQLSIAGANHPITMDFDPEKIQVIVSNLLSNAIKFTSDDGKVELGARQIVHEGIPYIQLEVRDTGPGIPEAVLPYVFNRYFSLDAQNGQALDGTGLGLSVTKELINLLDGTITVDSSQGEGTVFTIRLPITQSAEQKDWKRVIENEQPGFRDIVAGAKTIHASGLEKSEEKEKLLVLIVEDNYDVIKYLVSLIVEKYRVETAENGQIGLEKAREIMPDLVISDIMMPVMDGFEFCSVLKTDLRTSHIPVILLTARVDAESRLEGLKMGADAYLAKPFDQQELNIRIQKLIELRKNLQDRYQSFGPLYPSTGQIPGNDYTHEDEFIARVRTRVEVNMSDVEFGIHSLCKEMAMSRSALYRKFSALTNITLHQFIQKYRLEKAKTLLLDSDLNITQVAFEVGFKNLSHFSKTFSDTFGLTPSEFRQNSLS
jgi:DNA-binding response OmpR family regulator/anti-sigma regulatory factor (Ser/Thr protein kinase)